MSPQLRRHGTVGFLAVLWTVARCSASPQQQASADLNALLDVDMNATLEQLWTFVGQAVKSAMEPLGAELADRLDRIDSKLELLTTRMDNQDYKLDGLATGMDNQGSKLDNQDSKLDNQDSKLDSLVTRLDNQDSKLDNQGSKLDNQDSKLDNQDSKLDSLVTRMDRQDSKLEGLTTQLDQVQTELSILSHPPRDCSDLPAGAQSGVHQLQPGPDRSVRVPAYCNLDTDGGNWTVIQRRADLQPRQNFYRGWQAYKEGFGELDAEFWWGLEHLWALASSRDRHYELRIDLADFDGETRHAIYQDFRISSERDGYRLRLANYSGDAGDSLRYHQDQRFSTKDRDQDIMPDTNCAQDRKGGWWYTSCADSNLNGPYLSGHTPEKDGVNWYKWRGRRYSLKTVEMKIRPT